MDKIKKFFSTPVEKIFNSHTPAITSLLLLSLFISNSFLSYGNLSNGLKAWIVFVGILAPMTGAFFLMKKRDPFKEESLPAAVPWVLAVILTLAIFLRFYLLTSLSWPYADEGFFGYFATLQGEKWDWRILHDFRTTPLAYSWGLSLFFDFFGHSLATLWLYSAAWSLGCVPLAWMAARLAYPRSLAFLVLCWMSLSFWPLYMGRFSTQCVFLVFWECITFFALAKYLANQNSPSAPKNILGLALLTGTGFYTYLAWPLVALMVGLTLLFYGRQTLSLRLKELSKFMGVVILCVIPLLQQLTKQYHGYFHHLWTFSAPHDFGDRLGLPISCLKDFFWGATQNFFHYGPIWGGFLNPLLTSLFFFALIDLLPSFRKAYSLWILAAFCVFFLPTILTNNFEIMRLSPMVPLLVLICAVGSQSLLSRFPAGKRVFVCLLVITASTALDFYHLFVLYPKDWERRVSYYEIAKSPEFSKAYALLKPLTEHRGPGLILLNFNTDPFDQTLFVATYSFNAAENPRLDPTRTKWAAVLANIHEEPYFRKLFPEGKWFWLSDGLNRHDGGLILEIIPVNQINESLLRGWTRADQSLKELTRLVVELGVDPDQSQMTAVLDQAYPLFKGDSLLESRFWRIRAFHHAAEGKIEEAVQAEKQAIEKGLPMAHLYNEMGCLLYKENKLPEARKAFEEALSLKLNLTDAGENLKNLQLAGNH